MPGLAPTEGAPILVGGEIVGHVTGSWTSPVLGHTVMLGWQKRTPFADRVVIDGREATVALDPVLRSGGPPCTRLRRPASGSWPIPRRSMPPCGATTAPGPMSSSPFLQEVDPLVEVEHRRLVPRAGDDADDDAVEDRRGARDHVDVTHGDRVVAFPGQMAVII